MKSRTVIILSLLLAACVAYVGVSKWIKERPAPQPPQPKPLFDPAIACVTQLTIAPADGAAMTFVKAGGQWKITQPLAARASEVRINDVLTMLESLRTARDFLPAQNGQADDATTGLDKPAYVVTAVDAQGKARSLLVGKPVPFTRPAQTYVRPEGDAKTYVAEADFRRVLSSTPSDYRDKVVLSVPTDEVVRVSVVGEQSYELQKADGEWTLVKPVAAPADGRRVMRMIGSLGNVAAERFVADGSHGLAMYGLESGKERAVIRVWTQAPAAATTSAATSATVSVSAPAMKEYALALGKGPDDETVYAKVPGEPAIFVLSAAVLKNLQTSPDDLRDKTIFKFSPAAITAIKIVSPKETVELKKDKDKWTLAADPKAKIDAQKVQGYLAELRDLQAQRFVAADGRDAAKLSLKEPAVRVELSAGERKLTLAIGKGPDSAATRFAAASDVQGMFELPQSAMNELGRTWKDFQEVAPATRPNAPMPGVGLPPGMQPED